MNWVMQEIYIRELWEDRMARKPPPLVYAPVIPPPMPGAPNFASTDRLLAAILERKLLGLRRVG